MESKLEHRWRCITSKKNLIGSMKSFLRLRECIGDDYERYIGFVFGRKNHALVSSILQNDLAILFNMMFSTMNMYSNSNSFPLIVSKCLFVLNISITLQGVMIVL